jgi:ssDNA-binding Zn-finger/Zn-ribbon topoisomerase 1
MEYRKAKGVKEQYNSLEELRAAWGCRELGKRRTKDLDKLEAQRIAFRDHHKCKACGLPMEYVMGSGVMTCKNPNCRGIKVERTGNDGQTIVSYEVAYDVLEDRFRDIAENIFD